MAENSHETVLQGFRLSPTAVAAGIGMTVALHGLAIGGIFLVSAAISAVSRSDEEPPRTVRVIEAKFVKLGEKLPPRKLPNKPTPQNTTSPLQSGKAVSKRPQEPPPDAAPPPENATEDLIARLGNRAKMLSDMVQQERNQEGDPEGIEEGTETRDEGDIYLGQLYAFFRRGLNMPTSITDSERAGLRSAVVFDFTRDGRVGGYRIVSSSGNADFDQAVRLRMEQAQGAMLPTPPEEIADQFLGQEIQITVVPPRN